MFKNLLPIIVLWMCVQVVFAQDYIANPKPTKELSSLRKKFNLREVPNFLDLVQPDRLKLQTYESDSYTVAEGYRKLGMYERAVAHYLMTEKSIDRASRTVNYPLLDYYIGNSALRIGDYKLGLEYLQSFYQTQKENDRYAIQIKLATEQLKSLERIQKREKAADMVVFAKPSKGEAIVAFDAVDGQGVKYQLTQGSEKKGFASSRVWSPVDNGQMQTPVVQPFQDVRLDGAYSLDSVRFYYTACIYNESVADYTCNIQYIEQSLEGWSAPIVVDPYSLMGGYSNITPFVVDSAGVELVYFSSNRTGAIGGYDIWKMKRLNNGTFTTAEHQGAGVNTLGDEFYPVVRNNSLYYSTDGKSGFGGFDCFKSKRRGGLWSLTLNLGESVNTQEDDLRFDLYNGVQWKLAQSLEGNTLLYKKDVGGSVVAATGVVFKLIGKVVHEGTALSDVSVVLKELKGTTVVGTNTVKTKYDGTYSFDLKPKTFYNVSFKHRSFKSEAIDLASYNVKQPIIEKNVDLAIQPYETHVLVTDYNVKGGIVLKGATLSLYKIKGDNSKELIGNYYTTDGAVVLPVASTGKYQLHCSKAGYLHEEQEFFVSFGKDTKVMDYEVKMVNTQNGSFIPTDPIVFLEGSAQLHDDSFYRLFKLIPFLEKNKDVQLEIFSKKSFQKKGNNLTDISKERARSVALYLSTQKVDAKQLVIVGNNTSVINSIDMEEQNQILFRIKR